MSAIPQTTPSQVFFRRRVSCLGDFDRRKRIGTNESLIIQAITALAATPPTIHAPDDVFARGEYFGLSSHQTSNERPSCLRVQKLDASVATNSIMPPRMEILQVVPLQTGFSLQRIGKRIRTS